MSIDRAKSFLVHLATDEDAGRMAREAHEAALLALAGQLGYDFSASDLRHAMADVESLDEATESPRAARVRPRRPLDS